MGDYGSALMTRNADGTVYVAHADATIGLAAELLANADTAALRVTSEGHLSLGSDGRHIYRPVRFDPAANGPLVLICERVGNG